MWNLLTPFGGHRDPKLGTCKGHFASYASLIGASIAPYSDKQFPSFKSNANPTNPSVRGHSMAPNSSPSPQPPAMTNPQMNNSAKKKRRRRRKKKNKKNKNATQSNQSKPMEAATPDNGASSGRQRHLSTAESEDSFVVFFADDDSENEETETTEEFGSADSIIPSKKVRFAASDKLCQVHPMISWSFAYQAARKGPWEQYARDRDRFKRRVINSEKLIGRVLRNEHRSRIFEQRFA